MKKFVLTCLCFTALLVTLCLPAQARITVGTTSVAPLSGINQTTLKQLDKELSKTAGTDITVRHFENDAAITNWLLRFQEIDAAIVTPAFIKQLPAGTLEPLADLHARNGGTPPLTLVVRRNMSRSQADEIKNAFLKLGTSQSGREILEKLGLAESTLPGETIKSPVRKAATSPVQPVKEIVALPVKVEQAPAAAPPKTVAAKPEKAKEQLPTSAVEKQSPPKEELSTPEKAVEPLIKTTDKTTPAEETSKEIITQEQAKPAIDPLSKSQESQTATRQEKPSLDKRLVIFVALVICFAMLLKIYLFALRWKEKKNSAFKPLETPAAETVHAVSAPQPETEAEETLIVETGKLGPGKVPALLQRCADLPKPVVLQVNKGFCEKLIYFAGGQVAGALTQDSETPETSVRWDKLGTLLIRESLINKEGQAQGMALVKEQPGLRFGEALLKLKLISLTDLRQVLTRQAKATIYSLILFPEGRYQIIAGDGALPPEESVALEVKKLILEASHHKSEWTAIRQALPNLNTALNFCTDGRSKLEKVNLSSPQEDTLALIDGQRSINQLCIESTMLDYEVYRLLYMMVKAGVLEQQSHA